MTQDGHAAEGDLFRRQIAALADFGILALAATETEPLFQSACERVAMGLGADFAKILQVRLGHSDLLVIAGVGWNEGVVGHATFSLDDRSAPAYAAHGTPVVIDDTEQEGRFPISDLLREHRVRSVVNVPIRSPDGAVFGVLEVDDREPRRFDKGAVNFLHTYAALIGAATDRQKNRQSLLNALRERDLLLQELQHRIKNNLQVVTSLVSLQARRARSEETRRELEAIRNRIETLRLVHDKLYATRSVDRVELRSYLGDLCANLIDFHGESAGNIHLVASLARMTVRPDVAAPLGLIVNEFMTNSVKHAFMDRPGTITVELHATDERQAQLTLRDDGPGFDKGANTSGGTGVKLIEMLARQIGAEAAWGAGDGTQLVLTFPPTGDRE